MSPRARAVAALPLLFERNPLPIWIYDRRTLRFLDVNRAAVEFYGYTRAQFLKLSVADLVPERDISLLKRVVARMGLGLHDVGVRRHLKKDGTVVLARITTQAIVYEGKPARLSMMQDVSAAAEAKAWFESLFRSSRDAISVASKDGRLIRVNRAYERLTGYTSRELLKMDFRLLTPPEKRKATDQSFRGLLRGLPSVAVEKEYVRKNGTRVPVELVAFPIKERGRVLGYAAIVRDVTERQRVEQRYRELYTQTPVMMHSLGRDGRIRAVSDMWLEKLGYTREEVIGRHSVEFLVASSREEAAKRLREFWRTGRAVDLPRQLKTKDGRIIEVLLSASAERDGQGRAVRALGVMQDVTTQRETEAWFKSLVASSRDAIDSVSRDGRLLDANPAFERLLGYSRKELLRMRFQQLTPPEYHELDEAAFAKVEAGAASVEFEKEMIHKSGMRVPVRLTAFAVTAKDGRKLGYAAVIRDITEKRRLEKEILDSAAREQAKVGRDLHDTVGQTITGISLAARALRAALPPDEKLWRQAERLESLSRQAIQQVRGLARGLLPEELLSRDLPQSLSSLADGARDVFGIGCRVSVRGQAGLADRTAAVQLFRIAQEAIHNAAKHGASRTRITLGIGRAKLRLKIADDGTGPSARPRPGGLGIGIMKHRARSLGGYLVVRRGANGGTEVVCECPRPRAAL